MAVLVHARVGLLRDPVVRGECVGRALAFELATSRGLITPVSVYPHAQARARKAFISGDLRDMMRKLPSACRPGLILLGDANCVGSPRDVVTMRIDSAMAGRGGGFRELKELLRDDYLMDDSYRHQLPLGHEVTHIASTRRSGARLDGIWLTMGLMALVACVGVEPDALGSDHRLVFAFVQVV